jgi:ribosomal protein S18 acetylase RimI-like enzyme
MNNSIKQLTATDAHNILALQNQTPSRNWSLKETQDLLSKDWIQGFGIEKEDQLIGLCILKIIGKEVEILELAVDEKWRQHGYAQNLWEHVQKIVPDAQFFLEVSAHNTPALKFYEKMGFTLIHQRANYYGPGDDALIYRY